MRNHPESLSDIGEWIDIDITKSCLDGRFTADQLRRIATEMDRLKAEDEDARRLKPFLQSRRRRRCSKCAALIPLTSDVFISDGCYINHAWDSAIRITDPGFRREHCSDDGDVLCPSCAEVVHASHQSVIEAMMQSAMARRTSKGDRQ